MCIRVHIIIIIKQKRVYIIIIKKTKTCVYICEGLSC